MSDCIKPSTGCCTQHTLLIDDTSLHLKMGLNYLCSPILIFVCAYARCDPVLLALDVECLPDDDDDDDDDIG